LAHLLSQEEIVQGEVLRRMLSESKLRMPTTLPEQPSWQSGVLRCGRYPWACLLV